LSGPAIVKSNSVAVSDIALSGGLLIFIAESGPFFNGTLVKSGTSDLELAILYATPTDADLGDVSSLGKLAPVLHIRNVTMPAGGGWSLCLFSSGVKRWFFDEFTDVWSLVVSVPMPGFYEIAGERNGQVGQLVVPGGSGGFEVNSSSLVVEAAEFKDMPSAPRTRTPTRTTTESVFFTVPLQGSFGKRRVPLILDVGRFLMWAILPDSNAPKTIS
jgi:hypothetical protein